MNPTGSMDELICGKSRAQVLGSQADSHIGHGLCLVAFVAAQHHQLLAAMFCSRLLNVFLLSPYRPSSNTNLAVRRATLRPTGDTNIN